MFFSIDPSQGATRMAPQACACGACDAKVHRNQEAIEAHGPHLLAHPAARDLPDDLLKSPLIVI